MKYNIRKEHCNMTLEQWRHINKFYDIATKCFILSIQECLSEVGLISINTIITDDNKRKELTQEEKEFLKNLYELYRKRSI